MNIKAQIGDVFSLNGVDFVVNEIHFATGKVRVTDPKGRHDPAWYSPDIMCASQGYIHSRPAPVTAPMLPQQNQQPVYGIFRYGAVPPTFKVVMEDSPPQKPGRRQVSHNGKDWCNYDLLLDADDFESYQHRRMV
jgi:hypothetical protein